MKRLLLRLCRRKPGQACVCNQARSILIRPLAAALGDGIMTTAALAQLKEALPGVKIGVIVSDRNRELFSLCPLADVLVEDRLRSVWAQRGKWDVYLDYSSSFTTAGILFAFLLKPRVSIAFDKCNKKFYTPASVKVYDIYCPNTSMLHLNARLALTPFAFAAHGKPHYVLNPPLKNNPYPAGKKKNILLCPWGTTRRLDAETLAKAVALCNTDGVRFWLLDQKPAADYLRALQKFAPKAEIAIGHSPSVSDFLAFIYYADGLFAIDSAAVHAACAYQVPVSACYAKCFQNLKYFAPLELPCVRLFIPEKEGKNNDDFSAFTPQLIKQALEVLL